MRAQTLRSVLDQYTLYHDLKPETIAWYGRVVGVYLSHYGNDSLAENFSGESISRLLMAKQQAGCSPWYVKSLRSGLVALLREIRGNGPCERVRTIKAPPLDPDAWTPEQVERLLAACSPMPEQSRWRWQLIILLGYYSGLDRCDIELLERRHIQGDGAIYWRRSKTAKPVFVRLPPAVVAIIDRHCPRRGPILRMNMSHEWFRQLFGRIVSRAGLHGTYKKLRKSSGSGVEQQSPGKGHKHLGNTRAIFEKHYEARRLTQAEPTMPPEVRMP